MRYQPAKDIKFKFSDRISKKLKNKHDVTEDEVKECFHNSNGVVLEDTREEHATNPPTQWFIAETNSGRKLKVVYVEDQAIYIKTAYEPNEAEIYIFNKFSK